MPQENTHVRKHAFRLGVRVRMARPAGRHRVLALGFPVLLRAVLDAGRVAALQHHEGEEGDKEDEEEGRIAS